MDSEAIREDIKDCQRLNWESFEHSCYKLFTGVEYYENAKRKCANYYGGVAYINNKRENAFVGKMVAGKVPHEEIWLGLTVYDLETLNYTNWAFGRPAGVDRCIQMINGGQWNNVRCYSELPFVCERVMHDKTMHAENKIIWSIPLSLVLAMLLFVSFLFVRSWKRDKHFLELRSKKKPVKFNILGKISIFQKKNETILKASSSIFANDQITQDKCTSSVENRLLYFDKKSILPGARSVELRMEALGERNRHDALHGVKQDNALETGSNSGSECEHQNYRKTTLC